MIIAPYSRSCRNAGMASPLVGIAGVNSLLFAAYAVSKRVISPFPQLSLKEIAAAGAMAGAANAILASPGTLAADVGRRQRILTAVQSRCLRCACKGSTGLREISGYVPL